MPHSMCWLSQWMNKLLHHPLVPLGGLQYPIALALSLFQALFFIQSVNWAALNRRFAVDGTLSLFTRRRLLRHSLTTGVLAGNLQAGRLDRLLWKKKRLILKRAVVVALNYWRRNLSWFSIKRQSLEPLVFLYCFCLSAAHPTSSDISFPDKDRSINLILK